MSADLARDSIELVTELHHRQGKMYGGGSIDPVAGLLCSDIIWHVPGASPIAGDHRGVPQVTEYFERRRQLAEASMRMHPGQVLSEGADVVQFVRGSAILNGERVSWKTIGIYRVDCEQGRICEVWLVPLDLDRFDQIWTPPNA